MLPSQMIKRAFVRFAEISMEEIVYRAGINLFCPNISEPLVHSLRLVPVADIQIPQNGTGLLNGRPEPIIFNSWVIHDDIGRKTWLRPFVLFAQFTLKSRSIQAKDEGSFLDFLCIF